MEDLENKIGEILGDPQAMAGILSLAQSLGLTPPEQTEPSAPPPSSPPPQQDPMASSMAQLLSMAGSLGGKELALLQALRPLLREDRRFKLDRAIQAARISQIAGTAMKTLGNSDTGR
ncbi:hypothetical protein ACTQ33_12470 [Candidatus Avoscillospira sp. LCP25S3_F1]|uniref:hypothetical protein n=1 Tax=Candidatus Avoscillospira sp. LCP25S3_F1 TaxID=3438825 RepID=UPI003F8F2E21